MTAAGGRSCEHSTGYRTINRILQIHKRLNFADLQKIDFCVFEICKLAATWSANYTLKVAALFIANFNSASEAKRYKSHRLN